MAHKQAKEFIEKNKIISKHYYDRKLNELKVNIGDKIKIEKEPRNKYKQLYDGPYIVTAVDSHNITYKDKNNKNITIHKNRVKIY